MSASRKGQGAACGCCSSGMAPSSLSSPAYSSRLFAGCTSCHGGRLPACQPFFLQLFRDQEGQFEGLVGIQARVGVGVIAMSQHAVVNRLGAAKAFGDILAGHLEVHATRIGAFRPVYSEEAPHLLENAIERPGLEAAAGLYGVAMHRVTRPDDLPSLLLHPPHQLRQMLL